IFMFPFFIPIPAKFFVLIYAGIALLMGFSSSGDSVAHFAHLGGAATGFLLIKFGDAAGIFRLSEKLFAKKSKQDVYGNYSPEEPKVYKPNWFKKEPEKKSEQPSKFNINGEEITQAKIDEILDKISASGYQNLTDREKHILFELSQKIK
ncbi:MAG: rhomboid family intramembrane serine protease, partial [Ignavibacteria bacterium]|nr:rhomboid family intramembrane serine protease [Ignavibacteria bacterium]